VAGRRFNDGRHIATLNAADEIGGGFGIGPGMVLVESIRPGEPEINVAGEAGYTFEVFNGTAEKRVFSITTSKASAKISHWENGYEDIPNGSWLRVDKSEIELLPNSKGQIKLFLKVPNAPENFNRKWMAVVACAPGRAATTGSSVGFVVASRVQIETAPLIDATGEKAGNLALTPSQWMMSDARPGDSWRKAVKIRNNTKDEHTYSLKSIEEVEKDAAKHDRYFGKDFEKVIKDSWVTPSDKTFTLKPGEVKELKLTVKVAATAQPGKRYEELVFLQDDKGHVDFIRLRTEVASPAAATTK
jgi:hypothetical protein